jgi:hypothetical protein
VGGAVDGHSLVLQGPEVDGLAGIIDEAFREARLPIEVRGGSEGGAEQEAEGSEERFHRGEG